MRASRSLPGILICVTFCLLFTACDSPSESEPPSGYQDYSSDGISISYPQTWSFSYDDSPGLYSSRGIALSVSDFSGVSILIERDQETTTEAILDGYVRRLNIGRDPMLKEVERQKIEISGKGGEVLRWVDTLVDGSDRELIIVKVYDQPSDVYAVFNLTDDDIAAVKPHVANVVKRIVLE